MYNEIICAFEECFADQDTDFFPKSLGLIYKRSAKRKSLQEDYVEYILFLNILAYMVGQTQQYALVVVQKM